MVGKTSAQHLQRFGVLGVGPRAEVPERVGRYGCLFTSRHGGSELLTQVPVPVRQQIHHCVVRVAHAGPLSHEVKHSWFEFVCVQQVWQRETRYFQAVLEDHIPTRAIFGNQCTHLQRELRHCGGHSAHFAVLFFDAWRRQASQRKAQVLFSLCARHFWRKKNFFFCLRKPFVKKKKRNKKKTKTTKKKWIAFVICTSCRT